MKLQYMERALKLAEKGKGRTSPNPMVGAVIVKNGKIVGEGWHKKAGGDHAEIAALKKAKGLAKGSTVYVTLEPCCHTGRTGPCTTALINAGVDKVVIGALDPNPLVSGKGAKALKKAGITVQKGVLKNKAEALNAPFKKFITEKLPFVTMKAACTLDGRIASFTGKSKWISNDASRRRVHQMRAEADAIMAGIKTVLADDPRLNVRLATKGLIQPLRVIVDPELKTPLTAKILHSRGGKVVIAAKKGAALSRKKNLEKAGAEILEIAERNGNINLKALLKELAKMGVVNLFLEGGARLYTQMLLKKLVDRAAIFYAPLLIGGNCRFSLIETPLAKDIESATRLKDVRYTQYEENMLIEGDILK